MRFTRKSLWPERVSSPKTSAYLARSSVTVMCFRTAISLPTFMPRSSFLRFSRALTGVRIRPSGRGQAKGFLGGFCGFLRRDMSTGNVRCGRKLRAGAESQETGGEDGGDFAEMFVG